MKMDTVFHYKIDAEIVVLIACDATMTEPNQRHLLASIREPCEYINIVNMLFNNMVTDNHFQFTQSRIIYSKSSPSRLPIAIPQHSLIPVNHTSGNFPYRSFHNFCMIPRNYAGDDVVFRLPRTGFCLACFAATMIVRYPTGSTQIGFQKQCFPFSTAYLKCSGLKNGVLHQ